MRVETGSLVKSNLFVVCVTIVVCFVVDATGDSESFVKSNLFVGYVAVAAFFFVVDATGI